MQGQAFFITIALANNGCHTKTHTLVHPPLTSSPRQWTNASMAAIKALIIELPQWIGMHSQREPKVNGTYVCVSRGLEGRTTLIVGRSFWWCLASRQVGRETQFKPKSVKCRRDQRYRCPWVIIHRSCSLDGLLWLGKGQNVRRYHRRYPLHFLMSTVCPHSVYTTVPA